MEFNIQNFLPLVSDDIDQQQAARKELTKAAKEQPKQVFKVLLEHLISSSNALEKEMQASKLMFKALNELDIYKPQESESKTKLIQLLTDRLVNSEVQLGEIYADCLLHLITIWEDEPADYDKTLKELLQNELINKLQANPGSKDPIHVFNFLAYLLRNELPIPEKIQKYFNKNFPVFLNSDSKEVVATTINLALQMEVSQIASPAFEKENKKGFLQGLQVVLAASNEAAVEAVSFIEDILNNDEKKKLKGLAKDLFSLLGTALRDSDPSFPKKYEFFDHIINVLTELKSEIVKKDSEIFNQLIDDCVEAIANHTTEEIMRHQTGEELDSKGLTLIRDLVAEIAEEGSMKTKGFIGEVVRHLYKALKEKEWTKQFAAITVFLPIVGTTNRTSSILEAVDHVLSILEKTHQKVKLAGLEFILGLYATKSNIIADRSEIILSTLALLLNKSAHPRNLKYIQEIAIEIFFEEDLDPEVLEAFTLKYCEFLRASISAESFANIFTFELLNAFSSSEAEIPNEEYESLFKAASKELETQKQEPEVRIILVWLVLWVLAACPDLICPEESLKEWEKTFKDVTALSIQELEADSPSILFDALRLYLKVFPKSSLTLLETLWSEVKKLMISELEDVSNIMREVESKIGSILALVSQISQVAKADDCQKIIADCLDFHTKIEKILKKGTKLHPKFVQSLTKTLNDEFKAYSKQEVEYESLPEAKEVCQKLKAGIFNLYVSQIETLNSVSPNYLEGLKDLLLDADSHLSIEDLSSVSKHFWMFLELLTKPKAKLTEEEDKEAKEESPLKTRKDIPNVSLDSIEGEMLEDLALFVDPLRRLPLKDCQDFLSKLVSDYLSKYIEAESGTVIISFTLITLAKIAETYNADQLPEPLVSLISQLFKTKELDDDVESIQNVVCILGYYAARMRALSEPFAEDIYKRLTELMHMLEKKLKKQDSTEDDEECYEAIIWAIGKTFQSFPEKASLDLVKIWLNKLPLKINEADCREQIKILAALLQQQPHKKIIEESLHGDLQHVRDLLKRCLKSLHADQDCKEAIEKAQACYKA